MKKSIFVVGVVFLAAWSLSKSADPPSKALYDAKCASCHSKDGTGNKPMEKAFKLNPGGLSLVSAEAQGKSKEEQTALIKKGKGKMPAFEGKISDKEIDGLVSYISNLGGGTKPAGEKPMTPKSDATSAPKVDLAKAGVLYKSKCGSCHGPDGKGNANMTKAFKVDLAALDLVDKSTLDKSDPELDRLTSDGVGKMPAFKGKLSEAEISSLTAYIRSLAK